MSKGSTKSDVREPTTAGEGELRVERVEVVVSCCWRWQWQWQ
jgi:hypothetical protein